MNETFGIISAVLISLCIAILSGLGVGSGGLFVIWLTAAQGVDAIQARGMNLLFFVASATAAMVVHWIKGKLRWRLVALLSLFAILGTWLGAYVGRLIDASVLRRIFGGMLVLSGIYTLFPKNKKIFQKPLYKPHSL
ncbi:MAG: sulfite exporter TauE/SafE family protein [Clostridia bacterium]|nr:sulfite exporter TauE/SafE family protein [Clostridia bacterium]